MAQKNLISAAAQANLNPSEKAQVDGLAKLLDSHKSLLDLPSPVAQQKFGQLTQDQQNAHIAMFGESEDAPPEQKRGWFGSAFHYVTAPVKAVVGGTFAALNEVSDAMTRIYRTGAIAIDQGVNIAKAFEIANDKGDLVFSPDRISKAKKEFGDDIVDVAMKVAGGTPLDKLIAEGTEIEKQIARRADIRYSTEEDVQDFQNALDRVNAAKYSPGRQIANILPGPDGSGALYRGISGFFDAGYRIFADPTLILGKAKKAYDAGDFLLYNLTNKEKYTYGRNLMAVVNNTQRLDQVFQQKGVVDFFNVYGAKLDELKNIRSTTKDLRAQVAVQDELRRIAPEFGQTAINEFIDAGVKDAATAKSYLENIVDVKSILTGNPARQTPLVPTLNAARKARIAMYRTANKTFKIDDVGQDIVNTFYGTGKIQYEDIAAGLTGDVTQLAAKERQVGRLKGPDGAVRMSLDQIKGRIDRFSRKFATIPYFRDNRFNVLADDAPTQIYRLARLANSRYHSKIITEAFTAGNEGQRKQIYEGIWYTLASIRGVDKSEAGQLFLRNFGSKGIPKAYATPTVIRNVDENGIETTKVISPDELANGQRSALFNFQLSESIATPSIQDLDRLATRAGIIDNVVGASQKKWAEDTISFWTISTLAGPKFPVRNAAEDLMLHLAVGDSPWGIAKSRLLSTRLRIAAGEGNLGFINKIIRKKDVEKYNAKIKAAAEAGDVNAAQTVMAEALLDSMVGKFLDKEAAEFLAEFAKFGRLDETMRIIGEGGKNGLRGADQFMAATDDAAKFGEMAAIQYDGIKYKEAYGKKAFGAFSPVASTEARLGWLIQLSRVSTDEIGRIAIANFNDETKGIEEIAAYLRGLSVKERERFQLYSVPGETEQTHAARAFQATKNLFVKENGELNEDLVSKVRFTDEAGNVKVSAANLGLDDLPDMQDFALAPKWISGPVLVPVTEGNQFGAGITEKLWGYMGEANARFSREPLVVYQLTQIRKDMRATGFEKTIMDRYTKGIAKTEEDLIKSLNPNISRTEGVSLVKTDFVKKFIEFDRTLPTENLPSSAKTIASITEDLKNGKGFTNPLILAYDVDKDGNLLLNLVEGNHRVQAALKAGIDDIPVRIVSNSGGISKFKLAGEKSKIQPDVRNYIPGSPNPSEILPEFAFSKKVDSKKLEEATANATRHLVDIAEDLARERVLAFVDNPAVRSQLAMAGRNFARFYRATEDFYRRIGRTLKYNPEALSRAALTYEGISHSGFVQTDDNGEQYFFYPGLNPVYKAVNGVMKAFGVDTAFQIPMPVEFSGKLKMVTPSMNPDSLFPTFAGPLAAFPIKVMSNLIPQFGELERALLGEYAEDQPMVNALMPAHVNRILGALNRDERSSQYASAFRKGVTYLEAAGYSPKSRIEIINGQEVEVPPTPGELQEYKDKLQSATLSVLALRAVFGFIAPASPQVTLKSDMAKWVRENQRTNFKQVFNNLLMEYNGDIDKTTKEWIRLFPNQMPFTVSESERNTVAVVRAVDGADAWIKENKPLLEKYKEGAPFLIPTKGDFNFDAYKIIFQADLKKSKTLDDYLKEVGAAKDIQYYYSQKELYEADLAANPSNEGKRMIRQQWNTWAEQYKRTRPVLQDELGTGGAGRQIQRQRAYQDLVNMLNDPSVTTQPKTRSVLSKMVIEFNAYMATRDSIAGNGDTEQNYKDLLRQSIKIKLQEIAGDNANAKSAYDVLFSRLIGD